MGKIGWGTIYAAEVLVAAPAVAGTAVVAVGFWLEEAVRKATGGPVRWQVDDRDEVRVNRQLAHLTEHLDRTRAQALRPGDPAGADLFRRPPG